MGRRPKWPIAPDKRHQGQDPALAVVVGPHDEQQVLDADDDDQRPENEREDTEDVRLGDGQFMAVATERLPEGVERAGADVAVHDPERAESEERDGTLRCMTVGRVGH
jgi:hypothetical protein